MHLHYIIYLYGAKILRIIRSYLMSDLIVINNQESVQTNILPHGRVFALELQQTDFVIRAKGGRQAELITPSGLRVSRLYSCGALTEINRGAKGGGYIRVADPTGVLVLYLKPRSPDIFSILDSLTTPAFVSVVASIESVHNPGESGFRLILEMIAPSDRQSRDQWILRTARLTLLRLERLLSVISGEPANDEEKKVISRYGRAVVNSSSLGGLFRNPLDKCR